MSPIVTAAGQYTERQALALGSPCRHAREWGPAEYLRRIVRRGQVDVLTFLSFDWFENSKPVWHVAVAVMLTPALLKRVDTWDHNDSAAAFRLAAELLGNAGDISKGRWAHKTEDGFDLYRAATPLETLMARGLIDSIAPLAPFMDASAIPELKEIVDGRNELGADGGATETVGADGAGAPIIRRRVVTAERVGDA